MARFVVVAWEVVALVAVKVVRVEEAEEMRPLLNSRVVEVAFSPVPRVLNGKEKVEADGNDVRQSPDKHNAVVAKLVVVAEVVVEFLAVTFWRVVEPKARKSEVVVAPPRIVRPVPVVLPPIVDEARESKPFCRDSVVVVAFSPVLRVVNGKAKPPALATGHAVLQSPERQKVVAARFVVVALVVVEFVAVKFWKVEEALARRLV